MKLYTYHDLLLCLLAIPEVIHSVIPPSQHTRGDSIDNFSFFPVDSTLNIGSIRNEWRSYRTVDIWIVLRCKRHKLGYYVTSTGTIVLHNKQYTILDGNMYTNIVPPACDRISSCCLRHCVMFHYQHTSFSSFMHDENMERNVSNQWLYDAMIVGKVAYRISKKTTNKRVRVQLTLPSIIRDGISERKSWMSNNWEKKC